MRSSVIIECWRCDVVRLISDVLLFASVSYLTCHGLQGGCRVPGLHLLSCSRPLRPPPLLLAGEVPPAWRPGRRLDGDVGRSLPWMVVELVSEEQIAGRGTFIS